MKQFKVMKKQKMNNFIFKSTGQYLGFIDNENIFSWDGQYLGWIEGGYVWDASGQFRGEVKKIDSVSYILKNMYALPPLPKAPKLNPLPVVPIPTPQVFISAINLEIGWMDGF